MIGSPAGICSMRQPVGKGGTSGGPLAGARRSAAVFGNAIICAFLFLATLFLFLRAVENRFINVDDPDYVTLNRHVQNGLSSATLRWSLTTLAASNWHPLTWISHSLDCQLYDLRAAGHHFTSVLLHSVNVVLLFLVLRRATGRVWPSALAAALFAWHPLRVESVAWVSERKDVLSGFFFFLCLLAYVGYARRPSLARYALVAVWLVFGLAAKQMLVTVPFVLLLLDFWPLQRMAGMTGAGQKFACRPIHWLVLEKLPLLALAACAAAVTFVAQRHGGGLKPTGQTSAWLIRSAYAPYSYNRYVWKTVYPLNLAAFYPLVWRSPAELGTAIAALAAVTAAVFLQWRRRPFLPTGWLWFLGMLLPVIGIVPIGAQSLADRYTYLPGIGLAIMASWSAAEWAGRSARARNLVTASAVAILAAWAVLTWRQLGFWHDTATLYTHSLAAAEDNGNARSLVANSRWEEAERQHLIATAKLQNADVSTIDTTPAYYQAVLGEAAIDSPVHYALAMQLKREGDEGEALQQLMIAVKIDPTNADAHGALADSFFRLRRYEDALSHYQRAAALQPGMTSAHHGIEACRAQLRIAPSQSNQR